MEMLLLLTLILLAARMISSDLLSLKRRAERPLPHAVRPFPAYEARRGSLRRRRRRGAV